VSQQPAFPVFCFERQKVPVSRIQFSARYKTELEKISLLLTCSSGKWQDNPQFEWLLCCIWIFFWCNYTRLQVKIFGPLLMYI